MRFSTLFLLLGLFLSSFFGVANAASLVLSERDCIDILERWAADPSSVPQHLVDECKEMIGAGTPVPDIKPAAGLAAIDPCSGPDAANSVQCWGPWKSLAPAAGGVVPVALTDVDEFDPRPELAADLGGNIDDPGTDPVPLGSCSPGAPCGFATLFPGTSEPSEGDPIAVIPFDIENDGSQFTVDPGGMNEIISNDNLDPSIGSSTDRFQNTVDGVESKLITQTQRDEQGNIVEAFGVWDQNDLVSPDPANTNSGRFVWGVASSQSTLDGLNGGEGIGVSFAGRLTGDRQTNANITVNFGSRPDWNGSWNNSATNVKFDAGGDVAGVNLVSDPNRFSSNVQGDRSYVQGVLLGERGDQSVAHAIDVTLDSGENIKGVGVLRQVEER
ncbi:MAG: hypothetical protein V3V22_09050 [Methylococcales bacterium]